MTTPCVTKYIRSNSIYSKLALKKFITMRSYFFSDLQYNFKKKLLYITDESKEQISIILQFMAVIKFGRD